METFECSKKAINKVNYRELSKQIMLHCKPKKIISDNDTELTNHAILKWCQDNMVEWHYIVLGEPTPNGFEEILNSKLQDE